MAGVYRRKGDKARGKAGRWTAWWTDEKDKQRSRVGFTDKALTLELAKKLDDAARAIREGLVDPADLARQKAVKRPIADHLGDYRLHLLAKGDTEKHANHIASTLRRLLERAGVTSAGTLTVDRIQATLGSMASPEGDGLSARTCNHALNAVKAFAWWLEESNRVARIPRGLASLAKFNERADRRVVRRALTQDDLDRLVEAAENGEPIRVSRIGYQFEERWMTGTDRAMLYRLAMATGFRANEIRLLRVEHLRLDGDDPAIVLPAVAEKNGKGTVQPISRDMAAKLAPLLSGKRAGEAVAFVPEKTAKLLRHDLARAEIPYRDAAGNVADFHALRHSYITNLIRSGVNPKIVQKLARHSTITLTMDFYVRMDDIDIRNALEGGI